MMRAITLGMCFCVMHLSTSVLAVDEPHTRQTKPHRSTFPKNHGVSLKKRRPRITIEDPIGQRKIIENKPSKPFSNGLKPFKSGTKQEKIPSPELTKQKNFKKSGTEEVRNKPMPQLESSQPYNPFSNGPNPFGLSTNPETTQTKIPSPKLTEQKILEEIGDNKEVESKPMPQPETSQSYNPFSNGPNPFGFVAKSEPPIQTKILSPELIEFLTIQEEIEQEILEGIESEYVRNLLKQKIENEKLSFNDNLRKKELQPTIEKIIETVTSNLSVILNGLSERIIERMKYDPILCDPKSPFFMDIEHYLELTILNESQVIIPFLLNRLIKNKLSKPTDNNTENTNQIAIGESRLNSYLNPPLQNPSNGLDFGSQARTTPEQLLSNGLDFNMQGITMPTQHYNNGLDFNQPSVPQNPTNVFKLNPNAASFVPSINYQK